MKTIKERVKVEGIKTLDRSLSATRRVKNTYARTKERAEETQAHRHSSPAGYAAESIQDKAGNAAREVLHHLPNPGKKAAVNFEKAKGYFQEAKRGTTQVRQSLSEVRAGSAPDLATAKSQGLRDGRNPAKSSPKPQMGDTQRGVLRPGYLNKGVTGSKATDGAAKTAVKNSKPTAKGGIKTAKKTVKTAERTAQKTVKTAKHSAKAAQKSAQASAKAAKAAQKAAREAAKAAAKASKAAIKVAVEVVKLTVKAIKGLISLIAAGGWIAVLVVVVICLIALLLGSAFGIFFSGEENPDTGLTVNGVIAEIDAEYTDFINTIIAANPHDLLDMSGARALWKQVLAVYTVRTVTDPSNPMEVATMNDTKAVLLRAVFWDTNTITHSTHKIDVEVDVLDEDGMPTGETETDTYTVLRIIVTRKTIDEMAAHYGFNAAQKEWLNELMKPEYICLWNALLYGVTSIGDGSIIEIAETQLGNIGGETFWRWYGFTERDEWCAMFVSWCAYQAGLIDSGVIPRFSSCRVGIQWFQDRGQWQGPGYVPAPGDLIFFDWEPDGTADHVGIVERVTGDEVHTIEGNSSDSVRRRSYSFDSGKIFGYGIPGY